MNSDKLIRTASLKAYAHEKMTKNATLRDIVLSEKDYLTPEEFLAKAEIWLKLLHSER